MIAAIIAFNSNSNDCCYNYFHEITIIATIIALMKRL